MTQRKMPGAAKPPVSPVSRDRGIADDIRARIAKLTQVDSVPDPIAVRIVKAYSSGLLSLDNALVIGGFAEGRFHSIEGPPGSGKTALALSAVAARQRLDPTSIHAIVDVEGTIDTFFARMLGVDTDPSKFIILRPETAEEACIMCMSLMGYSIKDKLWKRDATLIPVQSIIYDSWAGSPTEEVGLAQLARVGAQWIPKIATTAERTKTTIFWINQIREKPGVSFGDPRYSPGGMALKHAQTTLLWVSMVNVERDLVNKQQIAHDLKVEVKKNKLAPPFAKVYLHLNYVTGFDLIIDALSLVERLQISFKEKADGNTFIFPFYTEDGSEEEIRTVGKENFVKAIQSNPEASEAFIYNARTLAEKAVASR